MERAITEEDHHEAVRRLLVGLAAGQEVATLSASIVDLHPKNNTFPGEVFMRLAAEVFTDTVAAGAGPVGYEGLRARHLEEMHFRGKENRKFQFAALCSAAISGGLEPDLLDEVIWWGTDDFWRYALLAAISIVRASAEQRDISVQELLSGLADRHNISLPESLANGR